MDTVIKSYTLTTDHAASSYGMPVLLGPDGTAYGAEDYVTESIDGGDPEPVIAWYLVYLGIDAIANEQYDLARKFVGSRRQTHARTSSLDANY